MKTFTARSSFIEEISYDEDRQILTVTVKGRQYTYYRVPASVVEDFVNAPSQGRYYGAYIKNGDYS